jgi:foldase protein PrsA
MKRLSVPVALLVVAAVVGVAAGCGGGGAESVPEGAVASVDGQPITRDDLNALLARAKKSYDAQQQDFPKAGTAAYKSLQTDAATFLVRRLQYEAKAGEMGIEVTDADVDKRIAEVKKEFFGGDDKAFREQLVAQGYTDETFRADIRAQLLNDALYEKVTSEVAVTDADIEAYYKENKAQFDVMESREVRHILVDTKQLADEIYAKLEAGGDFAKLAKQYSKDPGSKESGGKLTISRGQTVAPFDKTAFLLPTNEISRPVKTEFGFHLIQPVSEVKPAGTTPLKDVRAQIRQQLETQKKDEAVQEWATQVQEEFSGKTAYAAGFEPPDLSSSEDDAGTDQSGG